MTTGTSEARLFASLAANNATAFYADLVAYLARARDRPMRLDDEPVWQIREQRLIRGQAQLGLVCGLQYVRSRERGDEPGMELLAAPVMLGGRYGLEPVYFSDVVVRMGHAARTFDDLSGTVLETELRRTPSLHRDRYVQVQDSDYDPIRMMATNGAAVTL
jgi:hypothetical protein